ncbi:MAG: hypothetical protein JWM27_746 [Gemmatimonadetes bacterium]|nr:hypothetical protein [Gemmatimonadota bacterium]
MGPSFVSIDRRASFLLASREVRRGVPFPVSHARVADGAADREDSPVNASLAPAAGSLLSLLAVAGAAALGFRLLRSLARLGMAVAEATALSGLIEVSARRGDLTSLSERRQHVRTVRRIRRHAAAGTLAWVALLLVPLAAGWGREAFAAAALLWLAPVRPLRLPPPPAEQA